VRNFPHIGEEHSSCRCWLHREAWRAYAVTAGLAVAVLAVATVLAMM